VFDLNRSGATIAWSYFHPNTPVPLLLQYVTEGDLWRFALPNSHAAIAYAYAEKFSFEAWDALVKRFDEPTELARIIERGDIYVEYRKLLIEQIAQRAVLVSFEGYECYLVSATHIFASDVGNLLARTKPPFALIADIHGDALNVSMRSDDSIDISAIARKYGGNGHPHAAAFRLKWGDPLPWKVITPA
jgi:oligoribonuclease NrnB/cAMP/cGMP phosphodiesterase (DHH superfamily)